MQEAFVRTAMLLGEDAMAVLAQKHVAVFGLGGVGSFCAEALARAGVGALTLVDDDTVAESNLNRQLVALRSTLGRPKAEVMAARIQEINPQCRLRVLAKRYTPETREEFFDQTLHYLADCIDSVGCKVDLIATALEFGGLQGGSHRHSSGAGHSHPQRHGHRQQARPGKAHLHRSRQNLGLPPGTGDAPGA